MTVSTEYIGIAATEWINVALLDSGTGVILLETRSNPGQWILMLSQDSSRKLDVDALFNDPEFDRIMARFEKLSGLILARMPEDDEDNNAEETV